MREKQKHLSFSLLLFSFLLYSYITPADKKAAGGKKEDSLVISRVKNKGEPPVRYLVIDNPTKLQPKDWYQEEDRKGKSTKRKRKEKRGEERRERCRLKKEKRRREHKELELRRELNQSRFLLLSVAVTAKFVLTLWLLSQAPCGSGVLERPRVAVQELEMDKPHRSLRKCTYVSSLLFSLLVLPLLPSSHHACY